MNIPTKIFGSRVYICVRIFSALFLTNREKATAFARKKYIALNSIPRLKGWGHHTARLRFEDKIEENKNFKYILSHVRAMCLTPSAVPVSPMLTALMPLRPMTALPLPNI